MISTFKRPVDMFDLGLVHYKTVWTTEQLQSSANLRYILQTKVYKLRTHIVLLYTLQCSALVNLWLNIASHLY